MIVPKPRILVVDDNAANLAAMRKLLSRLPCEAVLSQSGNDALAACLRDDFALMFLDIEMPEMDGYEVAELLKGDPATSGIPIIFLTATPGDKEVQRRVYEAGAADYIEKPLDDGVVLAKAGVFLDLYASRQQLKLELARSEAMRTAARENEARYHQALDGAPIPVMVHAEDGEVILVNRVWQEATGYAARDIATIRAWSARAFGGQADQMRAHLEGLYGITGIVHEGEYVVRTAHGTNLIWNFRSTPLAALPDGRRLVASMAEDITAYRRALRVQEESRRLAQRADEAKGEFLANMSHEIRTPMNAIIGLTQLALETELTPRQQDYLQKVKSSASALLGILNDVLDYSKIEAGRLDMEQVPFFLEETLRDVAHLFLPAVERKGLEMFVEVAPETPLSLVGDPLRMGQVLNNLVGNAVKFTDKGEIHLRVEPAEDIAEDAADVLLRFSIRDTGIGLSPEQMERLFRPFMQADGSTTRRYGGSGLGLTICRRLAELMGGDIAVASTLGQGSTFSFTARVGVGPERRNLAERHHLHGLKALVVDDQETSRLILKSMIENWSGRITALSGGAAVIDEIERAEAAGSPYEIVLLDWQMPDLDGIAVARRIESEVAAGRIRRTPMVIMVTAFGKEQVEQAAAGVHLDGFLTKPVTPSALFNAVMGVRDPTLVRRTDDRRRPHVTPYEIAMPIRGAHVLVVEDNPINQEVAREFLERAGLSVTLAGDGRQGVEAVRATPFDAVLMDLQMPGMDGLEAARLIRRLPGRGTIPIIAMTAAALSRDKQACAEAGMNDHVAKPIVPADLLAVLLKWIAPRPQEASSAAVSDPQADPSFPNIDGIDSRQASLRLAGNRTLFLSLLGQMTEKFAGAAIEVRQALAAGQRDEAARLLHTLRGVAGNVSAIAVAGLASQAEAAIRDGKDAAVPALLDRLQQALDGLCAAIRAALQGEAATDDPGEPPSAAPPDPAAVSRLMVALRRYDAAALDQFEALRPAIAAAYGRDVAARLKTSIDSLRFDEAAGILSGIESP